MSGATHTPRLLSRLGSRLRVPGRLAGDCAHISALYHQHPDTNLVAELAEADSGSTKGHRVTRALMGAKFTHPSMRQLVISSIHDLVVRGQSPLAVDFLRRHHRLPQWPMEAHEVSVVTALFAGDLLLAALYALELARTSPPLALVVNELLRVMLLSPPGSAELGYAMMRLIDTYGHLVTQASINDVVDYLADAPATRFFANSLWHHWHPRLYPATVDRLLAANIEGGDRAGARAVYEAGGAASVLLATLLDYIYEFPEDTARVVAAPSLPVALKKHPAVVAQCLEQFSTTDARAYDAVVLTLEPPLLRSVLGALFVSSLKRHDEQAVERCLEAIFALPDPNLAGWEVDGIVCKLLGQGHVRQAMAVVAKYPELEVNKTLVASIAKHVVLRMPPPDSSLEFPDDASYDFLVEMGHRFSRLPATDPARIAVTEAVLSHYMLSPGEFVECFEVVDEHVSRPLLPGVLPAPCPFDFARGGFPPGLASVVAWNDAAKTRLIRAFLHRHPRHHGWGASHLALMGTRCT